MFIKKQEKNSDKNIEQIFYKYFLEQKCIFWHVYDFNYFIILILDFFYDFLSRGTIAE